MKRLVELPSGAWIDIDSIESIEDGLLIGITGSVIIMKSGRNHKVEGYAPKRVVYLIRNAWRKQEGEI